MTTSPLANPTATREMLEAFGLATKHRLGQNFLIDNHVIERIMALAELTGSERVLESVEGVRRQVRVGIAFDAGGKFDRQIGTLQELFPSWSRDGASRARTMSMFGGLI